MGQKTNEEIKELIPKMIDFYRGVDCFLPVDVKHLLELAESTDKGTAERIKKFYSINTEITSNGGIPVLKEILQHI